MRPFESPSDGSGTYVAALSTPERLVLAQVTGDVVELLGGEDVFLPEEEEPDTDAPDASGATVCGSDTDTGTGSAQADGTGPRPADPAPRDPEPAADDHPAFGAVRSVFDGIHGAPTEAPTDPAVRRLLPDASSDAEIAEEFRRYTDDDLRQRKVERLLLFAELLLEVPPSADENAQLDFVIMVDEAEAIAGALADIRLVIGERLDLRTDRDSEELYDAITATWEADDTSEADRPGPAGDGMSGPRLFLGSVFLLAGYLQESLTDCMLQDFRRRKRQG